MRSRNAFRLSQQYSELTGQQEEERPEAYRKKDNGKEDIGDHHGLPPHLNRPDQQDAQEYAQHQLNSKKREYSEPIRIELPGFFEMKAHDLRETA